MCTDLADVLKTLQQFNQIHLKINSFQEKVLQTMLVLTNPSHDNVAPEFHPTKLCFWEKTVSVIKHCMSLLRVLIMQNYKNVFHYTDISQRATLPAGFTPEKH